MLPNPWASDDRDELEDDQQRKHIGTAPSDLTPYFDLVQLLWLDKEHCRLLEEPFTKEEIAQVIYLLPGNKAHWLDGLTAAFYKEYAGILAPHLLTL
ncbi:hypothetical protein NDU88_006835 [Pleurodeles waltl]|uniref:Uncharacterized protein n=1 Tax=Pleurodeles waltl TaxID=8319 RepID=A0AAV7UN44_PLEWA|nr:hypothetical protein NDU88_006835 [Pleurodeles waltl]